MNSGTPSERASSAASSGDVPKLLAPSVAKKIPANACPRLRFSSSRNESPSAVAVASGFTASSQAAGRVGDDSIGTSLNVLPKENAATSSSLRSADHSSSFGAFSISRITSPRGSAFTASAFVASSVCSSPFFKSSIPRAIAARFKSAGSNRGSAIFMLALASTSVSSVRRIVLSTVNASTGRSSSSSSRAKRTIRSAVSTRLFTGESSARASRQYEAQASTASTAASATTQPSHAPLRRANSTPETREAPSTFRPQSLSKKSVTRRVSVLNSSPRTMPPAP